MITSVVCTEDEPDDPDWHVFPATHATCGFPANYLVPPILGLSVQLLNHPRKFMIFAAADCRLQAEQVELQRCFQNHFAESWWVSSGSWLPRINPPTTRSTRSTRSLLGVKHTTQNFWNFHVGFVGSEAGGEADWTRHLATPIVKDLETGLRQSERSRIWGLVFFLCQHRFSEPEKLVVYSRKRQNIGSLVTETAKNWQGTSKKNNYVEGSFTTNTCALWVP